MNALDFIFMKQIFFLCMKSYLFFQKMTEWCDVKNILKFSQYAYIMNYIYVHEFMCNFLSDIYQYTNVHSCIFSCTENNSVFCLDISTCS